MHVLAPEEVQPQASGDLSLIDIETEAKQEVTLDGAMRGLYQRRVAAWRMRSAMNACGGARIIFRW